VGSLKCDRRKSGNSGACTISRHKPAGGGETGKNALGKSMFKKKGSKTIDGKKLEKSLSVSIRKSRIGRVLKGRVEGHLDAALDQSGGERKGS